MSTKYRQSSEMSLAPGDQQNLRGKLRTYPENNGRGTKMSHISCFQEVSGSYRLTLSKQRLRSQLLSAYPAELNTASQDSLI